MKWSKLCTVNSELVEKIMARGESTADVLHRVFDCVHCKNQVSFYKVYKSVYLPYIVSKLFTGMTVNLPGVLLMTPGYSFCTFGAVWMHEIFNVDLKKKKKILPVLHWVLLHVLFWTKIPTVATLPLQTLFWWKIRIASVAELKREIQVTCLCHLFNVKDI